MDDDHDAVAVHRHVHGDRPVAAQHKHGAASHLRVSPYQHYRVAGAERQPVPVPVHDRVQSDMRGHTVRHVEEHQPGARGRAVPSTEGGTVRGLGADHALQEVAALLFGGLRTGAQGSVRRHTVPGAHHYIAHIVLRAHIQARADHVRRHGGERLRAVPVRHDHDGHDCRHDTGIDESVDNHFFRL